MNDYPALSMNIAGEHVTGGGRRTHAVVNPATGEVIGHLPHASVYMGVPTHYTRLLQDPALTRLRVTADGADEVQAGGASSS